VAVASLEARAAREVEVKNNKDELRWRRNGGRRENNMGGGQFLNPLMFIGGHITNEHKGVICNALISEKNRIL
jgi:hypothetical protein